MFAHFIEISTFIPSIQFDRCIQKDVLFKICAPVINGLWMKNCVLYIECVLQREKSHDKFNYVIWNRAVGHFSSQWTCRIFWIELKLWSSKRKFAKRNKKKCWNWYRFHIGPRIIQLFIFHLNICGNNSKKFDMAIQTIWYEQRFKSQKRKNVIWACNELGIGLLQKQLKKIVQL